MLKGTLLMTVQELMAKSALGLKSGSRKDQVLNSGSHWSSVLLASKHYSKWGMLHLSIKNQFQNLMSWIRVQQNHRLKRLMTKPASCFLLSTKFLKNKQISLSLILKAHFKIQIWCQKDSLIKWKRLFKLMISRKKKIQMLLLLLFLLQWARLKAIQRKKLQEQ